MPFNPRGYYDDELYMSFYQSSVRNPVYMASFIYLGAQNAEIEFLKKIWKNEELDDTNRNNAYDAMGPIRVEIEALKRHKANLIAKTRAFFEELGVDPESIKPDLTDLPRIAELLPQYRFMVFVREQNPARYELKYDYNQDSESIIYMTYNRFLQKIKGCNDSPIKENAMFNIISPCRMVNTRRYHQRANNIEVEDVVIALVGLSMDDKTQEAVEKLQDQVERLTLSGFECN